jgi:hypothetical protein
MGGIVREAKAADAGKSSAASRRTYQYFESENCSPALLRLDGRRFFPLSNPSTMNPLTLSVAISVSLAALSLSAIAAPGKNRKKREPAPAPASTPASVPTPEKPVTEAKDVGTKWRIWKDNQGRQLEAAFCALQDDWCTVQARNGQIHRLQLNELIVEDRVFAAAAAKRQAETKLKADYVKKAAYQIDFHIGSTLVAKGLKFNPPATDSQFVRRVYLDTIGRIPTAEEATLFLKDNTPDKRAKLIDALLASPGYTMHMFDWMGDMLRIKDMFFKGTYSFLFQDWLKDQLAADRPWDVLVRELLTADGKLCENGATGFLLRDAQMPLDGVSNLLSTFLGANVACAQCHDHPLADWSQKDFYQMAAFFGASDGFDEKGFRDAKRLGKKQKELEAVPLSQLLMITRANVFRMQDLPSQQLKYPKDYKYDDAKPESAVVPQLIYWNAGDKGSAPYRINTSDPTKLREEFARWMTHPDNPRFATAIANRLWKKVFGLAVQEPVDDLDDPKKAFNPALLGHLTEIMKTARFDLQQFQRVLLNSQTYQRAASPAPDLATGPYLFPGPVTRRLSAEQMWNSLLALTVGPQIDKTFLRRGTQMPLLSLPNENPTAESFRVVIQRLEQAGIRPTRAKSQENEGATPGALADAYQGTPPQRKFNLVLARASELPQPAPERHFLRLFGASDRLVADSSTTDGSVPQALMLMNGPAARLVSDSGAAALQEAAKNRDTDLKVASLFLSFYARQPTFAENNAAKSALQSGLSLGDLAWTLLNSREFLFLP